MPESKLFFSTLNWKEDKCRSNSQNQVHCHWSICMCHKWISGGEKGVAFALLGRIWWRDAQIDRTVGEWWGRFSQNYSSWGSALLLYLQYRVCGMFESIERWEGKASIGSSISTGRQTRIEQRRRRRTRSNETKEEEEHLAPMLEGVTQIIGQSRERKWEGYEEWEKVEETTRETMRVNIGSSIGSTSIHWVGAILLRSASHFSLSC